MDAKQKTTAALVAAVITLYGTTATGWLGTAKAFFQVRQIECPTGANPCPTNLQKLRFVLTAIPMARTVNEQTGVPVSAIVAQASLETGFGTSYLWRTHRNGFGIKCSGTWKDCVSRYDTEYVNGQKTGWVSKFRSYQDATVSFLDYATFLRVNPRYRAAWSNRRDGIAFTREVARAGYATDPAYHTKVSRIITALDLKRFDLTPEQWRLRPSFCTAPDRAARRCQ